MIFFFQSAEKHFLSLQRTKKDKTWLFWKKFKNIKKKFFEK
jgi:hypothetical protein